MTQRHWHSLYVTDHTCWLPFQCFLLQWVLNLSNLVNVSVIKQYNNNNMKIVYCLYSFKSNGIHIHIMLHFLLQTRPFPLCAQLLPLKVLAKIWYLIMKWQSWPLMSVSGKNRMSFVHWSGNMTLWLRVGGNISVPLTIALSFKYWDKWRFTDQLNGTSSIWVSCTHTQALNMCSNLC